MHEDPHHSTEATRTHSSSGTSSAVDLIVSTTTAPPLIIEEPARDYIQEHGLQHQVAALDALLRHEFRDLIAVRLHYLPAFETGSPEEESLLFMVKSRLSSADFAKSRTSFDKQVLHRFGVRTVMRFGAFQD